MHFIKFDIVSFYPSITEQLLSEAIEYAKQFIAISKDETDILWHTRKQLVTWGGKIYTKINSNFDVSMGSYDGSEASELIGLFALHKIRQKFPNESIGLYRDDGLGVTKRSGPQASALEKELHKIFHSMGLKVTTEVNIRKTEFLDIVLDLQTGRTAPFKKPLETPVYVNKESSHPPNVIRRISTTVGDRLCGISSSKDEFDRNVHPYQEALQRAGHKDKLVYSKPAEPTRKKNRKRKSIWWNPPYSKEVQSNLTKMFYSTIQRAFPKNHPYLSKLFNKQNMKFSYSCTRNMGAIIASHNSKIIRNRKQEAANNRLCNCTARNRPNCPLRGQCLTKSLVYRAEISTDDPKDERFYIGASSSFFKERYANHLKSIRHEKYGNETTLSTYFWNLKAKGKEPNIKWSIVRKAPAYHPSLKKSLEMSFVPC